MNALEERTYTDGFLVLLFGCHVDYRTWGAAVSARLFDGGRLVRSADLSTSLPGPGPGFLEATRDLLTAVAEPPSLVAAYGNGWDEVLAWCFPAGTPELRILDLHRAACCLARVPSRTPLVQLAGALGMRTVLEGESPLPCDYDNVLWALAGRAGEQGMDWDAVLRATEGSRATVSFDGYEFDRETLAALPDAPGTYVMRDADGAPLYVGKAASIAARVPDYFRAHEELPAKLVQIRERTRSLEYQLVGSEIEALLEENRLIRELSPEVNVQRTISSGSSRYGRPRQPVVVICPSATKGRRELFFLGTLPEAVQLRVIPGRPPKRQLLSLVRLARGASRRLPSHPGMKRWGEDGNELCFRYWARFRNSLNWLFLEGPLDRVVAAVTDAVRAADAADEPAEFRLGS